MSTVLYVHFVTIIMGSNALTKSDSICAVPPLSISLGGINGPVSADIATNVVCRVTGARPSPKITFWLDSRQLEPDGSSSSK